MVLSMSNITGFQSPTELEHLRYSIWGNAGGFTLFQVPPYHTHIIFKRVVGDSEQPYIRKFPNVDENQRMQRDPNLPAAIFPILCQHQQNFDIFPILHQNRAIFGFFGKERGYRANSKQAGLTAEIRGTTDPDGHK